MKKIFSLLIALALVLSFSLVAVPVAANGDPPNTVASSTMIFKGSLTDAGGGVYTGTIAMVNEQTEGLGDLIAGFDVYAKNGGCAYCANYYGDGGWNCAGTDTYLIGSDHDAYGTLGPWGSWWDPDCADWNQYSLQLTADHWYLRYTPTNESPMSGVMYWYGDGTGYAAETELGTQAGGHDGSAAHGGGAHAWDWDCGWGVEVIPLQYQGFYVTVTAGGSYTVTLTPADGRVKNLNTGETYGTIQAAVAAAGAGHTIQVSAGTYVQAGQIVIDKDLTIIGANKQTTIIMTSSSFSDSYFFRVNAGRFNLSNVTLDGNGNLYGGVRFANPGTGTIDNNIIKNVVAPSYTGFGVVVYANGVSVSNNIFTNIGRVGIWVGADNALVTGNTYTGKGAIDCLDYGIEVGMGGVATITDNTITNCKGVASSDGSTSAGILVTTYYGAGTTATITGNTLTDNTGGIAVGYDASDTSTVVAHYNNIYGNTAYGVDTTAPVVDARYNWWSDASGPSGGVNDPVTGTPANGSGDSVSTNVRFDPWTGKTTSVSTTTGTGNASFTSSGGAVEAVTAVATPPNPPVTLTHGLFSFNVTGLTPGQQVTITIVLPNPVSVGAKWWKYQGGTWYSLPIGSDDGDNTITITLKDGDFPGDADKAANGVIIDPGGPGYQITDVYGLQISSNEGGSVTTPGEGLFPYLPGTVVSLVASPDAGYEFVNWTGDVDTVADVHDASTKITMEDWYSITANFEEAEAEEEEEEETEAEEEAPPTVYPTLATQAATSIGSKSATLNMDYTVGTFNPLQVRFAYKKSVDSAWSYTDWVSKSASGTYTEPLTGLAPSTTYDFKAQLKYDGTVIEGMTLQFTTAIQRGCFIATAAYGTPTAEQIDVLREFRDVVLLESTVGSQFVALYYQLSPPIADFIAGNEFLRILVREFLVDPIVWVVEATGDMWRN